MNEEVFDRLRTVAATEEVSEYEQNLSGYTELHVESFGDSGVLYAQQIQRSGDNRRIALASYVDGEVQSPESMNVARLEDMLSGSGEVELNGDVLEQKNKRVDQNKAVSP